MKKLVITVCLLLVSLICGAPNISSKQKKDALERSYFFFLEREYQKELDAFVEHLGFRESSNDWTVINDFNCFGEWQFAHSTLEYLGYGHITPEKFKKNPEIFPRELQLKVLETLISVNDLSLNTRISVYDTVRYSDYIGKTINGIPITRGGLLAGMHLGGLGGIKIFLISEGRVDKMDGYGTKVSDYIREFSIYELSKDYLDMLEYIEDPNRYYFEEHELLANLHMN